MNAHELVALLDAVLVRWSEASDEARELDAALGDGDLGVTISRGAAAARTKIAALDAPTLTDVVKGAGMAFANANPSTLAALIGGALLAGAKTLDGIEDLDDEHIIALARTAAASIETRGKAALGDKTILDALLPSLDAAEAAPAGQRLRSAIGAAKAGVHVTTSLQARRGRAAWLGERSAGHPDPGATAYLRLLEACAKAIEGVQS